MHPNPSRSRAFKQYKKELARRYVVLDREERRRLVIKGQAELIAQDSMVFVFGRTVS